MHKDHTTFAKHTCVMLLDALWKEHLYNVDSMRQSINLRSYAQKDPLSEYKIDVFKAFEKMIDLLTTYKQ